VPKAKPGDQKRGPKVGRKHPRHTRPDTQKALKLAEASRLYLVERLSQTDVAKAMGVSQPTVSKWVAQINALAKADTLDAVDFAKAVQLERIEHLVRTVDGILARAQQPTQESRQETRMIWDPALQKMIPEPGRAHLTVVTRGADLAAQNRAAATLLACFQELNKLRALYPRPAPAGGSWVPPDDPGKRTGDAPPEAPQNGGTGGTGEEFLTIVVGGAGSS
jgi:predicted transcriptional regulator